MRILLLQIIYLGFPKLATGRGRNLAKRRGVTALAKLRHIVRSNVGSQRKPAWLSSCSTMANASMDPSSRHHLKPDIMFNEMGNIERMRYVADITMGVELTTVSASVTRAGTEYPRCSLPMGEKSESKQ